jgi:hypothetical protein
LAFREGVPGFLDVLDAMLIGTKGGRNNYRIVRETETASPLLYREILAKLAEVERAEAIKVKL